MKSKDFITEMPNVNVNGKLSNDDIQAIKMGIEEVLEEGKPIGTFNNVNLFKVASERDISYAGTYNNADSFFSMSIPMAFPKNAWCQKLVWRDTNNAAIKGIGQTVLFMLVNEKRLIISDGDQLLGGDFLWNKAFEESLKTKKYDIGAVDLTSKKIYPYDGSPLNDFFSKFSSYNGTTGEKGHLRYYIKKK